MCIGLDGGAPDAATAQMKFLHCAALLSMALAGCASMPSAPSVAVMPAPNKPFEVFQEDNAICLDFAQRQIGGIVAAPDRATTSALAGAALGAAAGALLGQSGQAAGIGAGVGLLLGAADANDDWDDRNYRSNGLQHRYDIAYQQCMYSKGNQVPGYVYQGMSTPLPPSTRVRRKK